MRSLSRRATIGNDLKKPCGPLQLPSNARLRSKDEIRSQLYANATNITKSRSGVSRSPTDPLSAMHAYTRPTFSQSYLRINVSPEVMHSLCHARKHRLSAFTACHAVAKARNLTHETQITYCSAKRRRWTAKDFEISCRSHCSQCRIS